MNKKQWTTLTFCFFLMSTFFLYMDITNGYLFVPEEVGNLCSLNEKWLMDGVITSEQYKQLESEPLDELDVHCLIRGEVYVPFMFLFFGLAFISMICGFLEPKKKKH